MNTFILLVEEVSALYLLPS